MDTTIWIVVAAALLTAIMTGVGALPFLFVKKVGHRTVGWSNAAAAGLMLAASHSLVAEGVSLDITLTLLGVLLGLGAIVLADRLLSGAGDVEVADLQGAGAAKALLILGIMTAHSFAEGVGVGVSFAGSDGLGAYITTAIAFHNVPEGLAIALVLVPRGSPVWKAALWAIFTSLPQPIMAAPSYLFVETFRPFLPIGLGLAAGAMIWMVFSELYPDALEKVDSGSTATAVTLAFSAMMAFQMLVLAH
ncbi:ZIP family metal transporter [Lutimaribacter sp. EGI FJ00015]|uniref:ZIP family metal transporter n=1 Tax=Lutimaribacter degradans TaxID=2945989 RepID=A0ACC6A0C9_9RHOB|nr:ZIP family metal transporter [Lutimaribacter sp. EGI FJ00013]MCM2563628.1 ZIP family metal transporter [Lutimaribacter sp. EGI FJ00013]MCO0614836.1 ZIP family metal transporter [Lutimaribacter sp. EGI FJ00015]MCO0637480.1 ZIP family metal transporter [Lutimaribacter sp. EGI FJ00014]